MTTGLATRLREFAQGPAYRWWALAAVECGHFVMHMEHLYWANYNEEARGFVSLEC